MPENLYLQFLFQVELDIFANIQESLRRLLKPSQLLFELLGQLMYKVAHKTALIRQSPKE